MRARTWAIVVLAASLAIPLSACADSAPQHRETTASPGSENTAKLDCGDAKPVSKQLSSGATWSMCWAVDPKRGLVLSDIHIAPPGKAPIRVIRSLAISQLEVPYDTGERLTSDITEAGFGGRKMKTLEKAACAGDRLSTAIPNFSDAKLGESPVREVLCSEVADAGLSYHSSDPAGPAVARKNDWRLSTVSRVGWYEYVTEYVFGADGTIGVRLGATGDLSPVDHTDAGHGWAVGEGDTAHAASHSHNAVWRVNWALGPGGGLAVEQYDASPTGATGPKSAVLEGKLTPIRTPALAQRADRRWWRVLAPAVKNDDGHPISYQIDLERTDSFVFDADHQHERAEYDIAFTNADDCQLYATKNRGGCGTGVPDFVERGKADALDDVVSWVAVGFHHVPRDEEQSPMELHWQGFTMMPRDLTARRFDVPKNRKDINGVPGGIWQEEAQNGLN